MPAPDPSVIAAPLARLDPADPFYNARAYGAENPGGFDDDGHRPPNGRDGMGNLFALAADVQAVGAWMATWVPTVTVSAADAGQAASDATAAATTAVQARDGILGDVGFQAVAADLVGPDDIGAVAAAIADVTACASNLAAILAAPAAASSAADDADRAEQAAAAAAGVRYATAVGGTADAIELTHAVNPVAAYAAPLYTYFLATADNGGPVTLAIDGLPEKPLTLPSGDALVAGDIVAGAAVPVVYVPGLDGFVIAGGGGSHALSDGLLAVRAQLADAERRLALNTLRDAIVNGWTLLDMVEGAADVFTDASGLDLAASSTYWQQSAGQVAAVKASGLLPVQSVNVTDQYGSGGAYLSDGGDNITYRFMTGGAGGGGYRADVGFGGAVVITSVVMSSQSVTTFQTRSCIVNGATVFANGSYGSGTYTASVSAVSGDPLDVELYNYQSSAADCLIYYRFFGYADEPGPFPLLSQLMSASAVPTAGRILALRTKSAAPAPDAFLSRDGGTSWSDGVRMEVVADYDATTELLSADIDLTSAGAGTSVVWRLDANSLDTFEGVWVQWR